MFLPNFIPVGERRGVLFRFGLTLIGCCTIGVMFWMFNQGLLWHQLVYSNAIGILIWLFIDVARFRLAPASQNYWPRFPFHIIFVLVGTLTGYILGTLIGDLVAGQSTLELMEKNPRRFIALIVETFMISIAWTIAMTQQVKLRLAREEAERARLKLLETQIEQHMLFNTLANLRALIGADPQRATKMLDHLDNYLRSTLSGSLGNEHTLKNELDRLLDYLELMAIRLGNRLSFSIDVPQSLLGQMIPTLLLQPLIENAIRHGIEPIVRGGNIQITARQVGQTCKIKVHDNGKGFELSPSNQGFGLGQIRERLAVQYGGKATLNIQSNIATQTSGTSVTITLPLKSAG
jgi:LytS/YehU family sensor histidine kinase